MTDSAETPNEANPYGNQGVTQTPPSEAISLADDTGASAASASVASRPASRLRLWPALLIVAFMWFLLIVPGKIAPLTIVHFMSMQLGPIVSALALAVWWLASGSVPWRQRWVGLLLIAATAVGVMIFAHSSMKITLLVYGLPVALTILVLSLALLRSRPWESRRVISYSAYALFLVSSLFVRIGKMDAAFAFTLVPRWAPTAEEQFLADLGDDPKAAESVAVTLPTKATTSDWAEFRGPRRDGIVRGITFETDWTSNPPRELWRHPIGPGWSAFCVVEPLLFTQEQRGEDECVVAYRVDDGEQVWVQTIAARFEASMGGIGPRATPTYLDGKLYVTGGTGVVQCLDAASGKPVWSYDLVEELSVPTPAWGFSSSPLVIGDSVIVFAGGGEEKGLVALDRESGVLRWSASDGSHSYCSPQLSTIDGRPQVLISSNTGLRSLNADDGSVLWQFDSDIGQMARVTQPLVIENAVYMGTGYGNGTVRVNVQKSDGSWNVEEDWLAPLKPYFNDFVHYRGHLYGFDDSIFASIDAETGDRNWKRGRYGFGQVLLVDAMGVLLVLSEDGEVVLLRADPERHEEITSFKALEGVTWNHPVISAGKLFVRNSEEVACFELPGIAAVSKGSL